MSEEIKLGIMSISYLTLGGILAIAITGIGYAIKTAIVQRSGYSGNTVFAAFVISTLVPTGYFASVVVAMKGLAMVEIFALTLFSYVFGFFALVVLGGILLLGAIFYDKGLYTILGDVKRSLHSIYLIFVSVLGQAGIKKSGRFVSKKVRKSLDEWKTAIVICYDVFDSVIRKVKSTIQ